MKKINRIKKSIEIIEAVIESIEFSGEDIDSMSQGDWLYLLDGISSNGYDWNNETIEKFSKILDII